MKFLFFSSVFGHFLFLQTELDHACLKPKPFPKAMTGAVGAYIDGAPLVCGGLYEDERDKCYRVRERPNQRFQ